MPLSAAQRRELSAAANKLSAHIVISAGEVSDAVVAHVARAFGKNELLKVRINTGDRAEADATGELLAERIGGEIIKRLGFVIVLYRPQPEASQEEPID